MTADQPAEARDKIADAVDAHNAEVQRLARVGYEYEQGALARRLTEGGAAMAALAELHSWAGLMSLLDEHWPADIFPTLADNPDRDTGPRLVSALRWVDQLRAARDALRALFVDGALYEHVDGHLFYKIRKADIDAVLASEERSDG